MSNVLNRTTKEFLLSVNTPDFSPASWIINPDLTAVAGFPSKYWSISGDTVTLMTQAERDAVDAAELDARRDATVSQLDETEDILRSTVAALIDALNVHISTINAILDAIDSAVTLVDLKDSVSRIANIAPLTLTAVRGDARSKLGS